MRHAPLAAALLLSASSSCTSTEPMPARAPSATTMAGAKPGAAITLRGRVSSTPWQHLMTGVPGKADAYFDLGGGSEQTVVYWKDPPKCSGDVEVTGKVLEVKGASKGSKADEVREPQVDVESARCVE